MIPGGYFRAKTFSKPAWSSFNQGSQTDFRAQPNLPPKCVVLYSRVPQWSFGPTK